MMMKREEMVEILEKRRTTSLGVGTLRMWPCHVMASYVDV